MDAAWRRSGRHCSFSSRRGTTVPSLVFSLLRCQTEGYGNGSSEECSFEAMKRRL